MPTAPASPERPAIAAVWAPAHGAVSTGTPDWDHIIRRGIDAHSRGGRRRLSAHDPDRHLGGARPPEIRRGWRLPSRAPTSAALDSGASRSNASLWMSLPPISPSAAVATSTFGASLGATYYPKDKWGLTAEAFLLGLGADDACQVTSSGEASPLVSEVCEDIDGRRSPPRRSPSQSAASSASPAASSSHPLCEPESEC